MLESSPAGTKWLVYLLMTILFNFLIIVTSRRVIENSTAMMTYRVTRNKPAEVFFPLFYKQLPSKLKPLNNPPLANNDVGITTENNSVNLNILANDRDGNKDKLSI